MRAGEFSSGTDEVHAKKEQDRPQELDEAMGNETGEAEDTRPGGEMKEGGWVREGGMAPMPHPLSIMQDGWHVQLPFFHPEHLELVFDLRS